jgi:hypothetical protein
MCALLPTNSEPAATLGRGHFEGVTFHVAMYQYSGFDNCFCLDVMSDEVTGKALDESQKEAVRGL